MEERRRRAGRYVKQLEGYQAFIPAPLPPEPPIRMDPELTRLLSDADRALGRLDGVATVLPNPDLFVAMFVRHEAVLSSKIEGTQSTLQDVLRYEVDPASGLRVPDTKEVVNYVAAMNHGLRRLPELPLSLRLLREIHDKLLRNVRGAQKQPGEFRRSQNWIGPDPYSFRHAIFIPPPPHEMHQALHNLETFLHEDSGMPTLVRCGIAHAQFETIHPFLDGNGRVGRLLITLLLCERRVLQQPLLYLSYYLKGHHTQYYDRLMAIRQDGDWEGWLKFFLRGVCEASRVATETARAILNLRERHRRMIAGGPSGSANGLKLLDYLFEQPRLSVRMAQDHIECAYGTAAKVIQRLEEIGILRETTGAQRNKRFQYDALMELFDRQEMEQSSVDQDQPTGPETHEAPHHAC